MISLLIKFTEENYYNSHENFINAYKNIKVFDKTDSLNFSIEKKKRNTK